MKAPAAPTDGLVMLAAAARASRVAASAARWLAATAGAFAALLALSVALALVDRSGDADSPEAPSSAALDFDVAVLRVAAARSLASAADDSGLRSLWSHRPQWSRPGRDGEAVRLVALRDAWAASVADRSRFRNAARGAFDAVGLLLSGVSLALLAAALAGTAAEWVRCASGARPSLGAILAGATALLAILPLWPMLDPALFHERTTSVGIGVRAALFVAAFAGCASGASVRALFGAPVQVHRLTELSGRRALLGAARLSAIEATRWVVPLVPALAAAAVFACAKADQDPSQTGSASGLGALIRAATRETSLGERLSSAALASGALVVLWFLGHRLVCEVRSSLESGA